MITERFLKMNKAYLIIFLILLGWYYLFILREINLASADLGRHIKSGEIMVETGKIVSTNLFSYTYPDFPFINHHWGSAVLMYFVWKIFGFSGLSFVFIAINLLTFSIFFRLAHKNSNFFMASLAAALVIPLIGERTEVRPEAISYFFSAVFFWILWNWKKDGISSRWLALLPVIELIWVNSHIYFFMGIFLLGIFWLDGLVGYLKSFQENNVRHHFLKMKKLTSWTFLTCAVTVINPFGIKLIIYPLNIFKNYGYSIVENQTVAFLDKWGLQNNNLLLIKVVIMIMACGFIFLILRNRRGFSGIIFCLAVFFSIMAWMALRNFTIFGFFSMPILAYVFYNGLSLKFDLNSVEFKTLAIVLFSVVFAANSYLYWPKLAISYDQANLGLAAHVEDAASFFREKNIQGPIFNDYDIGSYLVFYLYPQKVFVDNRPEAYPDDFFKKVYIPMQESDEIFNQVDGQYHFNAIFFYLNDATNWGQEFLVRQVNNPDWAPVFADNYSIIFLRRNEINQDIINRYEIPKSRFGLK